MGSFARPVDLNEDVIEELERLQLEVQPKFDAGARWTLLKPDNMERAKENANPYKDGGVVAKSPSLPFAVASDDKDFEDRLLQYATHMTFIVDQRKRYYHTTLRVPVTVDDVEYTVIAHYGTGKETKKGCSMAGHWMLVKQNNRTVPEMECEAIFHKGNRARLAWESLLLTLYRAFSTSTSLNNPLKISTQHCLYLETFAELCTSQALNKSNLQSIMDEGYKKATICNHRISTHGHRSTEPAPLPVQKPVVEKRIPLSSPDDDFVEALIAAAREHEKEGDGAQFMSFNCGSWCKNEEKEGVVACRFAHHRSCGFTEDRQGYKCDVGYKWWGDRTDASVPELIATSAAKACCLVQSGTLQGFRVVIDLAAKEVWFVCSPKSDFNHCGYGFAENVEMLFNHDKAAASVPNYKKEKPEPRPASTNPSKQFSPTSHGKYVAPGKRA